MVSGDLKWTYTTNGQIKSSSPAIANDGTIYIGSFDTNLYAINPDGTLKWYYPTNGAIQSSPSIDRNGIIYFGSNDNKLYSLNPDGTLRWSFSTGNLIYSSPAIDKNNIIYFGSTDRSIYALNPDGTLRWSYPTPYKIYSSPAITQDNTIYIGSGWIESPYQGRTYAFDSNGILKWEFVGNGRENMESSPAIDTNGIIYIGNASNPQFFAINPDGTQKWTISSNGAARSAPAIDDHVIIYESFDDNLVKAINPDGTLRWLFDVGAPCESSPAIAQDNTIYVGSFDHKLYALNPDGSQKWNYTTGGLIRRSSPAIAQDGTVYIGTEDGKLYAIEGSSPPLNYPKKYYIYNDHNYFTMRRNQNPLPTPANIVSTTLTVDKNDCIEPCTINGTVSWTNTGETASSPTNLDITYNTNTLPIAQNVIINPGETLPYMFSILNLIEGTYTIQASPNAGTTPQIVTVNKITGLDISGTFLLAGGLLLGTLLLKKNCKDYKTEEECEKNGCLWENGKCVRKKYR